MAKHLSNVHKLFMNARSLNPACTIQVRVIMSKLARKYYIYWA